MDIDIILEQLLSGKGKLSLLLLQALNLAKDHNEDALITYIEEELYGYKDEIPDYRKIKGQLLVDVQNQYGVFTRGMKLDSGELSEKLGFDLNTALTYDGITFLEDNLEQLTSDTVSRPLARGLVQSFNEMLKDNMPGTRFIAAYHSFGRSQLQFILSMVRQEVISKLQSLKRKTSVVAIGAAVGSVVLKKATSVFVTYAWDDDKHNSQVMSFVNFLRQMGYDAFMDRLKAQESTSMNFSTMMVKGLTESDKVIVVLSPKYKLKAEAFEGGVGVEYRMILEEMKNEVNKFIFVSFHAIDDDLIGKIVPIGIKGTAIMDLKRDQDNSFNALHAALQSKNIIAFSEVSSVVPEIKEVVVEKFEL